MVCVEGWRCESDGVRGRDRFSTVSTRQDIFMKCLAVKQKELSSHQFYKKTIDTKSFNFVADKDQDKVEART
jgi:hypothetical protein